MIGEYSNNMKNSKYLQLNKLDFIKGLFLTMLTTFLFSLSNMLTQGTFNINYLGILATSLGTGISYLIKNLFTNSQQKLFKHETMVN